MKDFIVAAQLYTVREYTQTAADVKETFRKVKEAGYNAIQVSAFGPIEPQTVKDLADEYGLRICATHINPNDIIEDFDGVVAKHKLWNCPYVGIGGMPKEYRGSGTGFKKFAEDFSVYAKRFLEYDLGFIYHNHKFEFENFNGKTGMDIIFEYSDPSFGFEIDTYWVQAGGASPVEWIYKTAGRMKVIHFKDMGIKDDQQIMLPIGRGNLPWAQIIKACEETDVEWAPVEQDNCNDECPFDCLKQSLDFCNKMMNKS